MRAAAAFMGLLLGAYALVALLAFSYADKLIFLPPPSSYGRADLSVSRIPVGDDSVAVVYLPAESALTILYSHGNAEDLGHLAPLLRNLHGLGFGVLAYDYRGYGLSQGGRASAAKATEDAEAVYAYATGPLGIAPARLVLYGRSVGSGPTLALAARHSAAGVVLESAFTSAFRVVTRVRIFPFDRFPNIGLIGQVHCPVLVIHGTADEVVPFAHGRALYDAAPGPKQSLWVEGAGHNDLEAVAGSRYGAALVGFAQLIETNGASR